MTAAPPTFAKPQQLRDLLHRAEADSPSSQVEQLETHISWVFLTADCAFKLKKPVRFEFLDFSTPSCRRQACEDEVRLNRRLAPDVYLGVVPIYQDGQGCLCLSGEGEPIDWLVKMRRLPAQRSLDRLISAGAVNERDTKQIADLLCRFFANAVPAGGEPETFCQSIERHVRANCRELRSAEYRLDSRQVQRVCEAQLRWLRLQRDVLEARLDDGRVIEGHGDLRPEHIYLENGTPVVIDCIEFNRDLHHRRQHNQERPPIFSCQQLAEHGLHDLGAVQEPMEVHQHQQRRSIRRRNRGQRPDRRQRIVRASVHRTLLAKQGQSLLGIPGSQSPRLRPAELGNLRQGIVMLVAFDPKAREARAHEFRQALSERHRCLQVKERKPTEIGRRSTRSSELPLRPLNATLEFLDRAKGPPQLSHPAIERGTIGGELRLLALVAARRPSVGRSPLGANDTSTNGRHACPSRATCSVEVGW